MSCFRFRFLTGLLLITCCSFAQLKDSVMVVSPGLNSGNAKAIYSVEEIKSFKYFVASDGRVITKYEIMCRLNNETKLINGGSKLVKVKLPDVIAKKLKDPQPGDTFELIFYCGNDPKKYHIKFKLV